MNLEIDDEINRQFKISNRMLEFIPEKQIEMIKDEPTVIYEKEGIKVWHKEIQ